MLSRYSHTGIGGRDATILATMKKFNVKQLVTHDKAFKKIDFIQVIDPVEISGSFYNIITSFRRFYEKKEDRFFKKFDF